MQSARRVALPHRSVVLTGGPGAGKSGVLGERAALLLRSRADLAGGWMLSLDGVTLSSIMLESFDHLSGASAWRWPLANHHYRAVGVVYNLRCGRAEDPIEA